MPTYEYHCRCCSTHFETEQSIMAPAGAECPSCHVWIINRLISGGTTFALKGDGWAIDSYSKKPSG